MCGLLGVVEPRGEPVGVDPAVLRTMRDAMSDRGPDGAGSFRHRNVALEHRRLAIRDLAGGAQPWLSDDCQCALVYNGEIYNDAVLRRDLVRLGHRFRTRCDTEVLMAAYRQWGAGCVEQLNGMFAFGLYDFRDETLLLVRDRFGIKPLFFAEVNGTLVFASTIAAILKHPDVRPPPCWPAVSHYLTTFRLTLGRQTVYEGIQQLLPGERLRWNARNGSAVIERYWRYPDVDEAAPDFEQAAATFESQVRDSVASQLASDVPVGMFLSGGVDSSTLACLVRDVSPRRMFGQCGGGDVETDDLRHARRCAAHVGFDFGEVRVGPDAYFERWHDLLDHYATPVSTPSDIIIAALAGEMKKSVGVVLGGEGADELLCGYSVQHWSGHDYDRWRSLSDGRWSAGPSAERIFVGSLRRQYGTDRFNSAADHYFAMNSLIPSAAKPGLLQPWAWRAADEDRRMRAEYDAVLRTDPDLPTSRRQTLLLHRVNLEALLSRLDSATMRVGLEARVPYTDHRLVESAFRLPERYKIGIADNEQAPFLASAELEQRGSLQSKRLLRTVADRLMPRALARRRKASFPTPAAGWLATHWSPWVRQRLTSSPFGKLAFQPAALQQLAQHPAQAGMWLWPILNVLEWGDRQFAA